MNQIAEGTFIGPEAIDRVEAPKPAAAEGATALGIERKGVQEGRPATDAKEFGFERLERGEASAADGYAGNFAQGDAANPAILWEE
jgi:hypothetical protein